MTFNVQKNRYYVSYRYKTSGPTKDASGNAAPASDRCAHCSDKFLGEMNRRRKNNGKPLYANVWTKELA
jgi:hypothetical protein